MAMQDRVTLEKTVEVDVKKYLGVMGIPFTPTKADRAFNEEGREVSRVNRGWQDLTACEPGTLNPAFAGKLLAIENKRPHGGKLSFEQAVTLQRIHQAQGLVCLARSVDDVIAVRTYGTRQCDLDEIAATIKKGPKQRKTIQTRRTLCHIH